MLNKLKSITLVGMMFCFITTSAITNSDQPDKEKIIPSCTLTVDCGNGTTVTVTAANCEQAGAAIDRACGTDTEDEG